jgi:hypothetical protein
MTSTTARPAELTGRIVRPGDADYPVASAGYNLLFTQSSTRSSMPLNAQGAGQPEQFDGVGEHADDVVATLVHRCVAPRRVR